MRLAEEITAHRLWCLSDLSEYNPACSFPAFGESEVGGSLKDEKIMNTPSTPPPPPPLAFIDFDASCCVAATFSQLFRYLQSKQLDFLARNYHALRVKHSITPSFAEDTGFDASRAAAAHAEVARSKLKAEATSSDPEAEGDECAFGARVDLGKGRRGWGRYWLV